MTKSGQLPAKPHGVPRAGLSECRQPNMEYWHQRAELAIAKRLLSSHALIESRREYLACLHQHLVVYASLLRAGDADDTRRLAARIAHYHGAIGQLMRRVKAFGDEIDRAERQAAARLSRSTPRVDTQRRSSSGTRLQLTGRRPVH